MNRFRTLTEQEAAEQSVTVPAPLVAIYDEEARSVVAYAASSEGVGKVLKNLNRPRGLADLDLDHALLEVARQSRRDWRKMLGGMLRRHLGQSEELVTDTPRSLSVSVKGGQVYVATPEQVKREESNEAM